MKVVHAVLATPVGVVLLGLFLAPVAAAVPDQRAGAQVALEARIVTVLKTDRREVGFEMLGSTWGRSQPKPGEHVWEGTDEAFSFLIAKRDGPFFQRALDEKLEFEIWRFVLMEARRERTCVIMAPKVTAFHERAEASLVVAAGSVSCP